VKRPLLALFLGAFAACAIAQSQPPPPPQASQPRPRPPGTTPLDAPPPPPPLIVDDPTDTMLAQNRAVETTRVEGDNTIQEYRVNGKLFMTRITPKHGRPYVMIDNHGDGTFTRMDSLEPGLRVPQWVLFEF
jgi:hypothetical protein